MSIEFDGSVEYMELQHDSFYAPLGITPASNNVRS